MAEAIDPAFNSKWIHENVQVITERNPIAASKANVPAGKLMILSIVVFLLWMTFEMADDDERRRLVEIFIGMTTRV